MNVYPWPHPSGGTYWRFWWHDESGKRKYATRKSKKKAVEAAREKAREIHNGSANLANLSSEQHRLCQAFLELNPRWEDLESIKAQRKRGRVSIDEGIEKFSDYLLGDVDTPSRYHLDLVKLLRRFGSYHTGSFLHNLEREDLERWLRSLKVGEKRTKDAAQALVRLWKWFKLENMVNAPNGLTVADRLKSVQVTRPDHIRYLSPEEMRFVLESVSEDYLPWAILAAFSGLRSEEIHPRNYGDKPPLDWSQIKLDQGHI